MAAPSRASWVNICSTWRTSRYTNQAFTASIVPTGPASTWRSTAGQRPNRVFEPDKAERKAQSSQRIPVEHAIAEHKWWRVLQRFTGRRELLPDTINAIAGIVSHRAITW